MKITLIMVMTTDGIIAKGNDDNVFLWTSPEDKKHFVTLSKEIGTVIMGSSTFEASGRKNYPGRLGVVLTSNPDKYDLAEGMIALSGSPEEIVTELEKRNVAHAALIGGARTNNQFLKAGFVDEIFITVEPRIFGNGLNFAQGDLLDIDLELLEQTRLNDAGTLLLHYKVVKHGVK